MYPSNAVVAPPGALPSASPRIVKVTTTTTTIIEHASDTEDDADVWTTVLGNADGSGAPPPFVPPPEYMVPPDSNHHYQAETYGVGLAEGRSDGGDDDVGDDGSRRSDPPLSPFSDAAAHGGETVNRSHFNAVYEELPVAVAEVGHTTPTHGDGDDGEAVEPARVDQHYAALHAQSDAAESTTHGGITARDDDDIDTHPHHVASWSPAGPTVGMTPREKVQWEKEERERRELSEHERKLAEEEFAEERRRAARDTFRDRFKLGAARLGSELETAVGESARPMSIVEVVNSDDVGDGGNDDSDGDDDDDDHDATDATDTEDDALQHRLPPVTELDSPPESPPESRRASDRHGMGGRLLAAARELSLGVEESVQASADLAASDDDDDAQ